MLLAAAVAVVCVASGAPPVADVPVMAKHRGVSYAHAWGRRAAERGYGSPASAASLQVLSDLGVDWIAITPFGFQRTPQDTSFRWGGSRFSETDDRLKATTRQAHARGVKVMLKPHVWLRPPAWAGLVEPETDAAWDEWFANYRTFMRHYAALARDAGIDALCIGNELSRTTRHEADWRLIIDEIRAIYDGVLTYGAHADEVWDVSFWDALDFIGVSGYFELTSQASPMRADLVAAWRPIVARLERLASRWEKPIVFTELGYRSVDFAARYPGRPTRPRRSICSSRPTPTRRSSRPSGRSRGSGGSTGGSGSRSRSTGGQPTTTTPRDGSRLKR